MRDAIRLAVGTLTIFPTAVPRVVDRQVGSWAMTITPLVGALLALVSGTVLAFLTGASSIPGPGAMSPSLLVAALVLSLLAVLTRGIHLDGLADSADGLGSGRSTAATLDIMRSGDVGPFGVVTLVFTLLIQVTALAQLTSAGVGPLALALALVVSRLVLPMVCWRGIPAARQDGLGRAVAGTVSTRQLLLAIVSAGASIVILAVLTRVVLDVAVDAIVGVAALSVLSLPAGGALCWWCVRRLGGVTGDVMGACVEVTFTATLVVLTLV